MAKTKERPAVPFEVATLARWLAASPKEHLKVLEEDLLAASEELYRAQAEPARIALQQAWDEQPVVFGNLAGAWLKSSQARLRRIATGALPVAHEEQREKSLRLLKKLATDKDREVRLTAIDLSCEDVNANMDALKKLAKTPDPDVKATLARHLQYVYPDNLKKALPILEELGADPDPRVHWAAAATLYDLYEREARAVLDVAHRLALNSDAGVRWAIAACFFEHVFADHFDQLLPTVRAWLRTGEPELRWTLARALRFLRVTARSLQLLRALYDDKDPEIRRRVVMFLVDNFDPRADSYRPVAEMLRRAKEDAAKRVREVAEEGEERLGVQFDALPLYGAELEEEVTDEEEEGFEEVAETEDEDDDY